MLGLNFLNTDQAEKQQTGTKLYPAAENTCKTAASLNKNTVFAGEESKLPETQNMIKRAGTKSDLPSNPARETLS